MSFDDNKLENEGSEKPVGSPEKKPAAGGIKPPMIGRKPSSGGIKPPMIGKKPAAKPAEAFTEVPRAEAVKPAAEAPKAEAAAPARADVKPVTVPTVESKAVESVIKPEVSAKPSEPVRKPEVPVKPVEPVRKPEVSAKPLESEKPLESAWQPAEPEKPLESVRKDKPVNKLETVRKAEPVVARKPIIPEDFDDDDDDDEYVVHDALSDDNGGGAVPHGPYPGDDDDDDDDDEEYVVQDAFADDEDEEKTNRKSFLRSIFGEAVFFLVSFLVILAIFYVFPPYVVNGPSMQKTLDNKAFGFGFRFGTPERGDIVIVNTGDREEGTSGDYFIKRVIGVPGDTIKCVYETYDYDVTLSDGSVVYAGGRVYRVYLNGNLLDEPYVWFGDVNFARECECTLGEDQYFIMGDNRFNSNDSRAFGPVSRSDIQCKMIVFIFGKHNPD